MTLSTLLSKLGVKVPENRCNCRTLWCNCGKGSYEWCSGYDARKSELLSLEVPEPGVMSVEEIYELIINDIVGKSAIENWGATGFPEFMEIGNIAKNRIRRLATAIHNALVERSK